MTVHCQETIIAGHWHDLLQRCPGLRTLEDDFRQAVNLLVDAWRKDAILFICGNGGSAADAEHIAGELLKGFLCARTLDRQEQEKLIATDAGIGDGDGLFLARNLQQGIRAVSLVSFTALNTAVSNDNHSDLIFAQPLYSLARSGDVLLAISTSGNARNVELAARTAKHLGMKVVGLSGQTGGRLAGWCDVILKMPAAKTHLVQELHQPVYHAMCGAVEEILIQQQVA